MISNKTKIEFMRVVLSMLLSIVSFSCSEEVYSFSRRCCEKVNRMLDEDIDATERF